MLGIAIVVAGLLNVVYLASFYRLMKLLRAKAPGYWEQIGSPDSFSGKDISAVLNNLYTRKMTESLNDSHQGLLVQVRVLFPTTFVVSGIAIYFVAKALQ